MSDSDMPLTKAEEDVLLSLDALLHEFGGMENFFGPERIAGYPDLTSDEDRIGEALVTLVEKGLVERHDLGYTLSRGSSTVVRRVERKRGEA